MTVVADKLGFYLASLPHIHLEENISSIKKSMNDFLDYFPIKERDKILVSPSLGGVHAAYISERGMHVCAHEIIPELLQNATVFWGSSLHTLEWITTLPPAGRFFNWVLNLGFTFGEDPEWKSQLRDYLDILNPGGKLVLEIIGRDLLEKYFHKRYWTEFSNGDFLLSDREIDYNTGILTENYVVFKDQKVEKFSFSKKIFYQFEIEQALVESGFLNIQFYGSFSGKPYDDSAEHLLVVAEKPVRSAGNLIKC